MLASIARIQLDVGRLESEPASLRHRVPGVDGQIHDDLLDLAGVGLRVPESRAEDGDEGDVFSDQAPEHLAHLRDHGIQVQHHRIQHLLAAEGEELTRQVGRPQCRLLDDLGRCTLRIRGVQVIQEELRSTHDHHEEIVEVVGDPAGQVPDGFHLAGLGQLVLALGELLVRPLSLVIETTVLQRDGGLSGESRGDDQILGAEPLRPPGENGEDAHHALPHLDGHGEHGSVTVSGAALPMSRGHPAIIREVRHEQGFASHGDSPGQALPDLETRRDQNLLRITP